MHGSSPLSGEQNVIAVVIAYAVVKNSLAGAQCAWFRELSNTNTRSSGASIAYEVSAGVCGFTPFVVTPCSMPFGWVGAATSSASAGRSESSPP